MSRHVLQWPGIAKLMAVSFTLVCFTLYLTQERCPASQGSSDGGILAQIQRVSKAKEIDAKRFNAIFGDKLTEAKSRNNMVLYECDKWCRTENKFYTGVVSAFLFSFISYRRFVINTETGCSMFNHFDDKGYGWKPGATHEIYSSSMSSFYTQERNEDHPYRSLDFFRAILHDFETYDYKGEQHDEIVIFAGEFDIINDILRHVDSFQALPEVARTLDRAVLIRIVYNGLFEMPKSLADLLHGQLLTQAKETNKLVCLYSTESFEFTDLVVRQLLKTYGDGHKFYFSDQGINDNLSEYARRVVQFDFEDFKVRSSCANEFDTFVTSYILQLCDVLIITNDPVGRHAAQMRGHSKGLYCADDNGVVYPCKSRLVAESFRDPAKLPIKFKSWHEELFDNFAPFL